MKNEIVKYIQVAEQVQKKPVNWLAAAIKKQDENFARRLRDGFISCLVIALMLGTFTPPSEVRAQAVTEDGKPLTVWIDSRTRVTPQKAVERKSERVWVDDYVLVGQYKPANGKNDKSAVKLSTKHVKEIKQAIKPPPSKKMSDWSSEDYERQEADNKRIVERWDRLMQENRAKLIASIKPNQIKLNHRIAAFIQKKDPREIVADEWTK